MMKGLEDEGVEIATDATAAARLVGSTGPFRCILADPPWKFRNQSTHLSPEKQGHYQTLNETEIYDFADLVKGWADPAGCHLWLCSPDVLVLDGTAQRVAASWGFAPKQILHWEKTTDDEASERFGGGNWMRTVTESIVLCTRGKNVKPLVRNVSNKIDGPISRHSAKPNALYRRIETISPGQRLEMFARGSLRPNWNAIWGNEVC